MFWMNQSTCMNRMESVDQYIRQRFIYVPENIETLQTPEYMLRGMEVNNHLVGDCDDISMLHAAMLTCLDIKTRFVAIKSNSQNNDFDHVYIEALCDGEWYPYDATVPKGTPYNIYGRIHIEV